MLSKLQQAVNWYCREYLKLDETLNDRKKEYSIENFIKEMERQVYYEEGCVLDTPIKLEWHITNYCNQKCYFCYSGMCSEEKHDNLDKKDLDKLLSDICNSNVLEVQIEGGEPLLYPHIEYVIESLKKYNNRIRLLTNGICFNYSIIDTIKRNFTKYDILQISIHGHSAQTHDKIVGVNGAFDILINNLLVLADKDVPVRISVVVTKENIEHFAEIFDLVKKFPNITTLVAQPTIPIGDAKIEDNVSNEKLLLAYYDVYKKRKKGDPHLALLMGHCFDIGEIKKYVLEYGKIDNINYCSAGRSRLCIEASGDIYPCHFMKHKEFLLGNIKNSTISEIWNNSNRLAEIRQGRDDSAYCNTCLMKDHCVKKGMCTSYMRNHSINDKPINCFFE